MLLHYKPTYIAMTPMKAIYMLDEHKNMLRELAVQYKMSESAIVRELIENEYNRKNPNPTTK